MRIFCLAILGLIIGNAANAADAPSSRIIGSAPVLIEPCVIMAVAEGAAGFVSAASFG